MGKSRKKGRRIVNMSQEPKDGGPIDIQKTLQEINAGKLPVSSTSQEK
jgi:hypothetical protein